eukprot:c2462_g1_i2.p2 GENE.c2462_g1_i2~~c2462_g1_i2.p2  ORF type:complete len:102 (+),score=13.53 c2462_g1_i2:45-350(+)
MALVEQLIRANNVVVFSSASCPYCRTAIQELSRLGVEFKTIDATSEMRSDLYRLTSRTSVPAVFVGGTYIGGCNDGGLGGVMPLSRSGKLIPMIEQAKSAL